MGAKKLRLKKYFRQKGFTLIELVLAIGISMIIFSVLSSIFGLVAKTITISSSGNEFLNSSYFSSNYIYREVASADYIIKNENKNSLGFALVNVFNAKKGKKYRYVYYVFSDSSIKRKALVRNSIFEGNLITGKTGTNIIAKNIRSVDSTVNDEIIKLNIEHELNGISKKYEIEIINRTFGEIK